MPNQQCQITEGSRGGKRNCILFAESCQTCSLFYWQVIINISCFVTVITQFHIFVCLYEELQLRKVVKICFEINALLLVGN